MRHKIAARVFPYILVLTLAGLAYGAVFTQLNILKFRSFFAFEWDDDAAESQAVYNTAVVAYPHQTVCIGRYFFGHFTPVYFLIALFYKIYPHIFTWYALMSFACGLAAVIVFLLGRQMLGSPLRAFIVALTYLAYPPLHFVNLGTLDGNNFVVLPLFLSFYFMQTKKLPLFLASMVLAMICKEDIPLMFILIGVYQLAARYPRQWWIATLLFSGVYTITVTQLTPLFHLAQHKQANAATSYFRYIDFQTIGELWKLLTVYQDRMLALIFEGSKWTAMACVLGPLLLVPLAAPEFYLCLPLLGEIFLHPYYTNDVSYYLFPVIPCVFFGYLFTLRRLEGIKVPGRLLTTLTAAILVAVLATHAFRTIPGRLSREGVPLQMHDFSFDNIRSIWDARIYAQDARDRLAWEFIRMIPPDVSVCATGDLLPALSSRRELFQFGSNIPGVEESPSMGYEQYDPYRAEYVLVNTRHVSNGLGGGYPYLPDAVMARELALIGKTHTLIRQEGGFFLFRHEEIK